MARDEASAHVLVLRLWVEPGGDLRGVQEWRGEVKDVLTGQLAYFRHQEGVVEAIRKLCADPARPDAGS